MTPRKLKDSLPTSPQAFVRRMAKLAVLVCAALGTAAAQTIIDQPQTNNYANWVLRGNASRSGSELILTPDAGSQLGVVWYKNAFPISGDFRLEYDVYLGSNNGGADGMALVIQTTGTTAQGAPGGGLGALGITPSMVLKMDTWYNTEIGYSDPVNADHLSLNRGDATTLTPWPNLAASYYSFGTTNIEDGAYHTMVLDYVASTRTLRVYWDGIRRISATTTFSSDFLAGATSAFVGFTASTGGATNLQKVKIKTLTIGLPPTIADPDNDGYSNEIDVDDDGDGLLDTLEGTGDPDGDGVINSLDLDSDNDGINDVRECLITDVNGDGRADGIIGLTGIIASVLATLPNADSDGVPNVRDLDSDNDGLTDLFESAAAAVKAADTNGDGFLSTADTGLTDADKDGIMSIADGSTTVGDNGDPVPTNSDLDTNPNYLDLDSNGNVTTDLAEAGFPSATLDPNGNGRIESPQNADSDNDGIANGVDLEDGQFGWPGLDTGVTTLAANDIRPTSASLGAQIPLSTRTGTLLFDYGTDATLASCSTTGGTSVGSGTGTTTLRTSANSLDPSTVYYFRAKVRYSTGLNVRGNIVSFRTTLLRWGPAGSDATMGVLDATVIPNTTNPSVVFSDASNRNFDVHLTTAGLSRNGMIHVLGEDSWWVEGASSGSEPSLVQFRFYDVGTGNPRAIQGIHFRLEDAELNEQVLNFSYWTAAGVKITVPWNASFFTYSHPPEFSNGNMAVENGAPPEGTTQAGKWIDIDFSTTAISGLEFSLKRRSVSNAGTIVVTHLGGDPGAFDFNGNFNPISVDTDTTAYGTVPDYRAQATHSAGNGTIVSQSPAPGTKLPAGVHDITLTLTTSSGETSVLGFHLTVVDRTPPTIKSPGGGFSPLTLTNGDLIPDYMSSASFSDNVAVTRIIQQPPAGSIAVSGITTVTISAYDARKNVTTTSIDVAVKTPNPVPGEAQIVSIASSNNSASAMGAPSGTSFTKFGVPAINDQEHLAFIGNYTSGTSTVAGIFAGSPPELVVSEGDQAPGTSNDLFAKLYDPCLNLGSGVKPYIAFVARIKAPDGSSALATTTNTGIWTNVGGKLTLVARAGDTAAPGTVFKTFQSLSLVEDEILFTAILGGSATKDSDVATYRWSAGEGISQLLREGQSVTCAGGTNKRVGSFQMLGAVAGSPGHGRHHTARGYTAVRVVCTDKTVITYQLDELSDSPRFNAVAQSGFQLMSGFTSKAQGVPVMTAKGCMAFHQTFSMPKGSGITSANNTGIVANIAGKWEMPARKGDLAGDTGMSWTSFADPVASDSGMIAWSGAITAANTARSTAIACAVSGGTPVVLARTGEEAPGCNGGVFQTFSSLALPGGASGPVFTAALASKIGKTSPGPGGVTTANDTGLWAVNSAGKSQLVLREGDAVTGKRVSAFTLLGIVPGSPGQARSYNGNGALVARLYFSDKTESIVIIRLP
ncbi:MAG: PASTA domain-containing protein [Verrucomicrobiaceae bacterium]|nr:PASTA domain-containing protein [Verrucomicrobiaceae bacterium]